MDHSHHTHEMDLEIEGMTCASCVRRVETAIQKVPGVESAQVNLATEKARVLLNSQQSSQTEVVAAIEKAGYKVKSPGPSESHHNHMHHGMDETSDKEAALKKQRQHVILATAFTIPLVLPMLADLFGLSFNLPPWVQFALATPVQFWLGLKFFGNGWKALKNLSGNMDLLVAIGTAAAFGLSLYLWIFTSHEGHQPHLYFESSAVIITFVLLGKYLESRAKKQATEAISALQSLRPETARVRKNGGETEIPVAELRRKDQMIIKAGERIPADGRVIEGATQVDESLLTGESLPVDKAPGNLVIGGSINTTGVIVVEATSLGKDSVLSRIIRLIETAQASKAPVEKLVDRISAIFVPAVLVIALFTIFGWGLATGDWETAIIRGVAVLVIACPCALGLATPASIIVGTGAAAKAGILIQNAEALEIAHSIRTVAFDKTGTLTEGKPRVVKVITTPGLESEIISIIASLQSGSEHPLAKAVLEKAKNENISYVTAQDIRILPGLGLQGQIGGKTFLLGHQKLMQEKGISIDLFSSEAQLSEKNGETFSYLADDLTKMPLALIAFSDTVKASALAAVQRLHDLGIRTVMLTGDNDGSARKVANILKIDEYESRILPAQKAEFIQALRVGNNAVAMVGDGINDAPALAAADIGIAMSTGTDVAMQTAGITLMQGDPLLIADAVEISRRTYTKIKQNLFWAFIYNIIGIPLAIAGFLNPVIAGAAMAFSSVSVISNALLLKRWKPSQKKRSHS